MFELNLINLTLFTLGIILVLGLCMVVVMGIANFITKKIFKKPLFQFLREIMEK